MVSSMSETLLDRLYAMEEKENLSKPDLDFLEEVSNSEDNEIRYLVAEILSMCPQELSKQILIRLGNDTDLLVRASACDSLSIFNDDEVVSFLVSKAKKERDSLVKSHAILSLVDILLSEGTSVLKEISLDILRKVRCTRVKIACYKALYLIGDEDYLDKIMAEISGPRYRNRCFAVNVLLDVLSAVNRGRVLQSLKEQRSCEKTVAVRSTLDKAIEEIEAQNIER